MSFPYYPRYRPSGLEWLGDLPEHWQVRRLRFAAQINPSKSEVALVDPETVVSFLPMEAIGDDGTLDLSREKPIAEVEAAYTYLREDDVAFAKITPCFENGKGALMRGLTNGIGFGTTELIVARPRSGELTSEYLHLLFTSEEFRQLGGSHMYGAGGQKRVPESFVADFSIPLPPIAEQCAVSRLLERETAKIDALLDEQRRLIEVLKEKRQAIVTRAVVKGLNPDAATTPTDVDWIGEVPSHWTVSPLKRYLEFLTSGSRGWAENYADDGEPFLRIGNLTRGGIDLDLSDVQRVVVPSGAEGARTRTHSGDLLFSITADLGSVAVVPVDLEAAYVSQHVALARLDGERVLSKWIAYCAISDLGKAWFASQAYGGAKMQLSLADVRAMPVCVPPISEQHELVAFIDNERAKANALISESERAVRVLLERRAALISAAVTGKIDVRHSADSATA